jgi:hypothetical protein
MKAFRLERDAKLLAGLARRRLAAYSPGHHAAGRKRPDTGQERFVAERFGMSNWPF